MRDWKKWLMEAIKECPGDNGLQEAIAESTDWHTCYTGEIRVALEKVGVQFSEIGQPRHPGVSVLGGNFKACLQRGDFSGALEICRVIESFILRKYERLNGVGREEAFEEVFGNEHSRRGNKS